MPPVDLSCQGAFVHSLHPMSKTKKSRAIRKKNRVKATKVAAGSDKGKGGSNNDGRGNNDGGSSQGTAAAAAAEYLQQWAEQQRLPKGEEGAWKFAKKRQVFLLKSWADRQQVSADTFKLLLLYARSLPEACAERTVKHAKDVAASAEKAVEALAQSQAPTGDEDDDDDDDDDDKGQTGDTLTEEQREEQRALLMIQRQRALRLIQVLAPEAKG